MASRKPGNRAKHHYDVVRDLVIKQGVDIVDILYDLEEVARHEASSLRTAIAAARDGYDAMIREHGLSSHADDLAYAKELVTALNDQSKEILRVAKRYK